MTSGTMLSPATVPAAAGRSRVTMRMSQRPYVRAVVLLDAAVIALAVGGGYLARFGGDEQSTGGSEIPYAVVAPALVLIWLLTLKMLRCYDNRVLGYGADEYRRVSVASFRLAGGVAIAGYLADVGVSRGFLGICFITGTVALVGTRFLARKWLHRARRRGAGWCRRVLAVGDTAHVLELVHTCGVSRTRVIRWWARVFRTRCWRRCRSASATCPWSGRSAASWTPRALLRRTRWRSPVPPS